MYRPLYGYSSTRAKRVCECQSRLEALEKEYKQYRESMESRVSVLEEKLERMKTKIRYMPKQKGAVEAKEEFESLTCTK